MSSVQHFTKFILHLKDHELHKSFLKRWQFSELFYISESIILDKKKITFINWPLLNNTIK